MPLFERIYYVFCKYGVWGSRRISTVKVVDWSEGHFRLRDNYKNSFILLLLQNTIVCIKDFINKQTNKKCRGTKRGVCSQTPQGLEQWWWFTKKGSQLWERLWWVYTSLANRLSEILILSQPKTGEVHMVSKESLNMYIKLNLTINLLNHVHPYKK